MNACDWELIRKRFDAIDASLHEIKLKEALIMSQLDDLNAAIQAEDVQVQALVAVITKVDADVTALLAKIAAGGTLPDITTQLQAIQSHTASLVTAVQQLSDDDTKANA